MLFNNCSKSSLIIFLIYPDLFPLIYEYKLSFLRIFLIEYLAFAFPMKNRLWVRYDFLYQQHL